eukprot:gnl/TRDRNA2_/TRDRNA2_178518_c0_seq1.p1 gnl/TRDRNA2_/TRDRNA2_178518_c0~~gnl/TRDRNA2_/TRDRNA2_178518_c0_seq1.p1  ORF type:complete len:576 (-),score=127.02 gnl/TRDRNA2_/TRDRNA2_178518_c0_seq1:148-1875(-)
MPALRSLVFVALLLGLCGSAAANFLALPQVSSSQSTGVSPAIRGALLAELEDALGSEHRRATESRLESLEALLLPTFTALPKNEHGKLGHTSTRYILHRLFIEKHGWSVRGLEPVGDTGNSSSAAQMLQGRVPEYVTGLFEQRLSGQGVSLHEAAVLAAMIENLVHAEALERIGAAFKAHGLQLEGAVNTSQLEEAVDTYMSSYVLGISASQLNAEMAQKLQLEIGQVYYTWNETQAFVREVQKDMALANGGVVETFTDAEKLVEEIGERYGKFQDKECRALKGQLMALEEEACSGRVPIQKFYSANLHEGVGQFSESLEYLRQIGALDESDPKHVSVIVANYVASPANCMDSSSFYSICCLDECEGLMGHIEKEVAAPSAPPERILQLVSGLASATVPANRTLSSTVVGHLYDIAQHHDGNVPLHGRLFAQWMHHAYPDECRFPHVSGTTNPGQPNEWMKMTGLDVDASPDEIQQHAAMKTTPRDKPKPATQASSDGEEVDGGKCLPWTMEEEFFVSDYHPNIRAAANTTALLAGGLVAAVLALFLLTCGLAKYLKRSASVVSVAEGQQKNIRV